MDVMTTCPTCREEMTPDRRTWCEHAEARYEAAMARLDEQLRPHVEAIRRSQVLTAEDYATVINCVAD